MESQLFYDDRTVYVIFQTDYVEIVAPIPKRLYDAVKDLVQIDSKIMTISWKLFHEFASECWKRHLKVRNKNE